MINHDCAQNVGFQLNSLRSNDFNSQAPDQKSNPQAPDRT